MIFHLIRSDPSGASQASKRCACCLILRAHRFSRSDWPDETMNGPAIPHKSPSAEPQSAEPRSAEPRSAEPQSAALIDYLAPRHFRAFVACCHRRIPRFRSVLPSSYSAAGKTKNRKRFSRGPFYLGSNRASFLRRVSQLGEEPRG